MLVSAADASLGGIDEADDCGLTARRCFLFLPSGLFPKKFKSPTDFFCFAAAVPGVLFDLAAGDDDVEEEEEEEDGSELFAEGLGDTRSIDEIDEVGDDFFAFSLTRFLMTGAPAPEPILVLAAPGASGAPGTPRAASGVPFGAACVGEEGFAGAAAGGRRILLIN